MPVTRRTLLGSAVGLMATGCASQTVSTSYEPPPTPSTPPRSSKPPVAAHAPPRPNRAATAPVDFPGATWLPAAGSNYTRSSRPTSYPVRYVVIHLTTDTFRTMTQIFRNPARNVSAHYMLRAADGLLAQCVREKDIAFHAGNWTYNAHSIGIEHEGWLEQRSYSAAMYRASARVTARLCARYDIPVDRAHIIGHSEVPGATHPDPGPHWDWDTYLKLVRARM